MDAEPEAERDWQRRRFFAYFRARLAIVEKLEADPATHPEQHILLGAGLDALAKYWAKVHERRFEGLGHRLGEFLVRHGQPEIFARCSAHDLRRRATAERPAWLPAIREAAPDNESRGLVINWTKDPDFSAVECHPAVRRARIEVPWLRKSRYGEILYHEHRCSWLHELAPSKGLASEWDGEDATEPRYQNWLVPQPDGVHVSRRMILFPRVFLRRTFTAAIDSFERECIAEGKCPVD